jgi:hypothetical protein
LHQTSVAIPTSFQKLIFALRRNPVDERPDVGHCSHPVPLAYSGPLRRRFARAAVLPAVTLLFVISSPVAAKPIMAGDFLPSDTFTLRFYDVDDYLSAHISNYSFNDQQVLVASFSQVTGDVDISQFVRDGVNEIRLDLINNSAGWTYGYDFRVNGVSVVADQCGVFNMVGCQNSDLTNGLAWSQNIVFTVSPATPPRPPQLPQFRSTDTFTLAFYDVDDLLSAYLTNSEFSDHVILSAAFGQVTGDVDVSSYVRGGANAIRLDLINTVAGWTYGYAFKVNGVSVDAGQCGVFNTSGCQNSDLTSGLAWSRQLSFSVVDSAATVPEPATGILVVAGIVGLWLRRSGLPKTKWSDPA